MDILGGITKGLGSIFGGGSSSGGLGASIWPAAILAGTQLISGLFGPDYQQDEIDYKNRALDLQNAQSQAELANALERAKIAAGAAGAGARAQVQAAGIAANAQKEATKQRAIQALMEGGLKRAELMDPKTYASTGMATAQQMGKSGDSEAAAFDSLIRNLQAPLLRRG